MAINSITDNALLTSGSFPPVRAASPKIALGSASKDQTFSASALGRDVRTITVSGATNIFHHDRFETLNHAGN
jgi:hypothetical protein